ncbi:uncharacterized protein LOC130826063 isoform X2 [Amaranthus tricolor]|uniref:uncharacterized protein LOC130826063 isoform X2 n=1 Tax=Amaranthus tricolor TaxID=29722 RepID=UPI0025871055|nr:uncharacterized protein LOC130826063 isoform X2 [Amaranthus tricolor]
MLGLGLGTLSQPLAPQLVLKKLPFLPYSFPNSSSLSLSSWGPTGFPLFAQKSEKISTFDEVIMEKGEDFEDVEDEYEFDDDEYDFDEEEEEDFDDDEEEEEEEEDELMVPFHLMNAWLEKRPKGFGEGKVYDTSLEDKLLEEIEQSLKAQIANVNKLKKEGKMLNSKNKMQEELFKASEGVPSGIRVRINNLPKKKNIYRDLKSAFKGVPGMINISPVNSGNKKTRDPVCKGLAFVDFMSVKDANSFEGLPYDGYSSGSEATYTFLEEDEDEDEGEDDDNDQNDTYLNSENLTLEKHVKHMETIEAKVVARASSYEEETKAVKKMPKLTNQTEVTHKPDRKPSQKTNKKQNLKSDTKPKPIIPGSAKKLKVKEKAKLAEVFSRYGTREAKASK